MDWRARRYYLVSFSWESYQMRIDNIKRIGAKLTPYRNISKQPDETEIRNSYQFMIGVDSKNYEAVEYELRKAERNDYFCKWREVKQDLSKKYFDVRGNVMPYMRCQMNPNKRCNHCMNC